LSFVIGFSVSIITDTVREKKGKTEKKTQQQNPRHIFYACFINLLRFIEVFSRTRAKTKLLHVNNVESI
jgi:hypothetical protein